MKTDTHVVNSLLLLLRILDSSSAFQVPLSGNGHCIKLPTDDLALPANTVPLTR